MTEPAEDKVAPLDQQEYRRRQRARANMMAWMLAALAVLFFFITIARMAVAG